MHTTVLRNISALAILLLQGTSANTEVPRHFECGAELPSADVMETISKLHTDDTTDVYSGSPVARAMATVKRSQRSLTIDTYFHVITSSATNSTITQKMMLDQLSILQGSYAPHRISFALRGLEFISNDTWATGGDDLAMKRSLRKGSYTSLNIYFQSNLQGNVLGKCTLPGIVYPDTDLWYADGCTVAAGSVPGGSILGYNMGKTAVHETGHWLGLLHTFEGYSCDGAGDYVVDTPQESRATDGCPVAPPKKSCSSSADVDPIHNYMDYSYDSW